MKRKNSIQQILFILCCITIIPTGIYARVGSIYSGFSYVKTEHSKSSEDKSIGVDVIGLNEFSGDYLRVETSTIKSSLLTGIKRIGFNRAATEEHILSATALFLILFITWNMIQLIHKKDFMDGMELIRFIHNSDGKKRSYSER